MRRSGSKASATRRNRLPASVGAALILTLGLAGCMTDRDTTGAIALAPPPQSESGLRDYAGTWGRRHDADPGDVTAAINYARALRGLTQYAQAAAVLESTAVKHPYDRAVLGAYGKALIDTGRLKEAADVLERAHTPERPDWTVLSAQGAVADQLGDHAAALGYYEAALKIAPGEPSVMSNLGLSYALAKQLPQADQMLRAAAASPRADVRVRQNFALVLALEGKFAEAQAVARRDLSPTDAAASVAAIREAVAQPDSWDRIRTLGRKVAKADRGRSAPAAGAPALSE